MGITAGPDGNLWFTAGPGIGRITPAGVITEFPVPGGLTLIIGEPNGITPGPDGNLWFTEPAGNKIGRITPAGTITEFPIPTANSGPQGITAGPDGNLWFTESSANKIGRITAQGVITEFPLPTLFSAPVGITTGPDGNLWFTEAGSTAGPGKIGRITPARTITEFPLTTSRQIFGITAGPDGNLWFTGTGFSVVLPSFNSVNTIGRITPTGTITEFPVLAPSSAPLGITAGPDGNLWFTEPGGNKIGRVPPVFLTISPASGVYMTTQHFDLTLRVYPAGLGFVAGRALFDGVDVTEALGLCGVVGTRAGGGVTLRCPNLSGSLFAPGVHTFSVSITLSDGSVASDTVTWQIEENHEP